MTQKPGEHLEEEPQSERGEPGSRDTGADAPSVGEHRREGAFEDESMTSSGEPGWQRPDDAGGLGSESDDAAVPPYDDRQKQAKSAEHMRARAGNPDGGGQAQKSAVEHEKPSSSDKGVGPAHQSGTRRGEDHPPETTHPEKK
ncbi:hypothetical protein C8K36_1011424 [Rhodococcus sp. OK519]|uniref:hypothetical protein n=1 Tax=Rhodococcus sp. OK519 TaxID=2135729 RepID=UPI000D355794|nr:hypothetical protein C8K36_1011424 [Rhodococcus sp. OK519]